MFKRYKEKPDAPSNVIKRKPAFTQRLSKEQRKEILAKLYPTNPRKES